MRVLIFECNEIYMNILHQVTIKNNIQMKNVTNLKRDRKQYNLTETPLNSIAINLAVLPSFSGLNGIVF